MKDNIDKKQFAHDLISSMGTAQLLELYGFDTLKDMMDYARMHSLLPETTKAETERIRKFAEAFREAVKGVIT